MVALGGKKKMLLFQNKIYILHRLDPAVTTLMQRVDYDRYFGGVYIHSRVNIKHNSILCNIF